MSSSEPTNTESKRSVYDTCDPRYLRELREAAGIDLFVLARTACLSVAQVRQLETDDNDKLFYSDAIKRQAYKRLLMILGAEPPTVEVPQALRDAGQVAQAHLNTLDQIVAMSHQPAINRSRTDSLLAAWTKLKAHKQAFAAFLFLLAAVVLFVLHGPQSKTDVAPPPPSLAASVPATPVPPVSVSIPLASATLVSAPAPAPVSASAPITPASLSLVVIPKPSECAYSNDNMPQLTPFIVQKEGRYVHIVSTSPVELCVVDGNKQATTLQMKTGESRSVYGTSPWQISSSHLSKVQIYFQGGRVPLPDAAMRIKLLEVPVPR